MDKTLLGLIGAAGALAASAVSPAAAAPVSLERAMQASSYADLLTPIPNASALLDASDAALAKQPATATLVQYRDHHHHRTYRRRRPPVRHHHHHHSMLVVPNAAEPV